MRISRRHSAIGVRFLSSIDPKPNPHNALSSSGLLLPLTTYATSSSSSCRRYQCTSSHPRTPDGEAQQHLDPQQKRSIFTLHADLNTAPETQDDHRLSTTQRTKSPPSSSSSSPPSPPSSSPSSSPQQQQKEEPRPTAAPTIAESLSEAASGIKNTVTGVASAVKDKVLYGQSPQGQAGDEEGVLDMAKEAGGKALLSAVDKMIDGCQATLRRLEAAGFGKGVKVSSTMKLMGAIEFTIETETGKEVGEDRREEADRHEQEEKKMKKEIKQSERRAKAEGLQQQTN